MCCEILCWRLAFYYVHLLHFFYVFSFGFSRKLEVIWMHSNAAVLPNMPEDLVDDFDFEAGL